eukprot:TRINITY_DN60359_c0_g1_i1.p1 TRINITY_DN60359_c0_g1~~TRINITY_DN60359_c0_g1_i1.p1  ORF type:complete len:353 (+),score=42.91 TRINITY_DN60359_c0_g1_i1:52-1110(+)
MLSTPVFERSAPCTHISGLHLAALTTRSEEGFSIAATIALNAEGTAGDHSYVFRLACSKIKRTLSVEVRIGDDKACWGMVAFDHHDRESDCDYYTFEDAWSMDGKAHEYLFAFAFDGTISIWRDGFKFDVIEANFCPRHSVASFMRKFHKLLEIGEVHSSILQFVSHLRVYGETLSWNQVYGRKRELEKADATCGKKMRTMWTERKFTDAEVHCNGTVFPVHRSVLAASSPVLDRMLETEGSKEGSSRALSLCEYSATAVESFLKFLYDGDLPEGSNDCQALLALADQYDVRDLIDLCCNRLTSSLNKDCAMATLLALKPYRHWEAVARSWNFLALWMFADKGNLTAVLDKI